MKKLLIGALTCSLVMIQPASAGIGLPALPTQISAPAVVPAVAGGPFTDIRESAKVTEVKWRGKRYYPRRHRRGSSVGAFGAGLAIGIVGALIAKGVSEASARDRFARCEAEFQSFDPETGTYITYSGEERLCPYLR